MNPNKALWEKGDFTQIARYMRDSGALLADGLEIRPGMKVLDLGCGDGTTALPIARLGADVTGIDIAANLIAAGTQRAGAAGLSNLMFREGDASNLHGVADATFDLVVSFFGAMFAPRPYDVASEMVRVTRPGGRIVMGNWIPDDPTLVAQILKTCAEFSPPPPAGFVSPMLWGREDEAAARFAAAGMPAATLSFERGSYAFVYPGPPAELLERFLLFYGPTMTAIAAAEQGGRGGELENALLDLFDRQNRSGRADLTEVAATFLRITVAKPF